MKEKTEAEKAVKDNAWIGEPCFPVPSRPVSGEGNAPRVNELIQNPDGSPKWENPTTVMQRGDSYGIPYKREGNAPREDLVCKNVPIDPVERYNSLASPSADESSNAPRIECDQDNPCGKCSDCREESAYANECANPSDGLGY